MGSLETLGQGLAHTEAELRSEAAAALARIAHRLEALLEELARIRAGIGGPSGSDRARVAAAHEALRDEARAQRWYLTVQREALGLFRHEELDRDYPEPGPLPLD